MFLLPLVLFASTSAFPTAPTTPSQAPIYCGYPPTLELPPLLPDLLTRLRATNPISIPSFTAIPKGVFLRYPFPPPGGPNSTCLGVFVQNVNLDYALTVTGAGLAHTVETIANACAETAGAGSSVYRDESEWEFFGMLQLRWGACDNFQPREVGKRVACEGEEGSHDPSVPCPGVGVGSRV